MFEPVTMTRSTSAVAPAPTCSGGGEAIAPGTRSCAETFPAMNRAKAMAARRLLIACPIRLVLIVSRSLSPRECGRLNRAEASQMHLNRDVIFERAACHSRGLYCRQVVSRRHRFILQ